MTRDLQQLMEVAVGNVRQQHLDRMRSLGVGGAQVARLGSVQVPFGILRGHETSPGLWEPGPGPFHVVQPVIMDGELVDVVAWRSSDPSRWLLRTGLGWLLGADAIDAAARCDLAAAVPLHATPLDWLRAAGCGVAVLDWRAPELRELLEVDAFAVTDPGLGDLLVRTLSKPARLPRLIVDRAARHAA